VSEKLTFYGHHRLACNVILIIILLPNEESSKIFKDLRSEDKDFRSEDEDKDLYKLVLEYEDFPRAQPHCCIKDMMPETGYFSCISKDHKNNCGQRGYIRGWKMADERKMTTGRSQMAVMTQRRRLADRLTQCLNSKVKYRYTSLRPFV